MSRNKHGIRSIGSEKPRNRKLTSDPVPEPHTEGESLSAEDKLRMALFNNPGASIAELALGAGIGRSTAGRLLAKWEGAGTVIRTKGVDRRCPATWRPTSTPDVVDGDGNTDNTEPDTDAPDTITTETDADTDSISTSRPAGDTTTMGPSSAAEVGDSTDIEGDTSTVLDGTERDTAEGELPAEEGPAATDTALAPDTHELSVDQSTRQRLPKGELRGLVEDYLTGHPSEAFGPAQIAKALGRSGGAVNNALEKLVADGYAIKTCEAPKRFSCASTNPNTST